MYQLAFKIDSGMPSSSRYLYLFQDEEKAAAQLGVGEGPRLDSQEVIIFSQPSFSHRYKLHT